jgi:hypothetical protein
MSNKSTKGFNGTPKARTRRNGVISRLEAQLKSGKKPAKKEAGSSKGMTELTELDTKRINKELEILKLRA